MDNFLEKDTNTFIHDKAIEILKKLNNIEFDENEVTIEKEPLCGISNTIYKVQLKFKNGESYLDVDKIFFKIFGRISVLVDRKLETYIMQQLYEAGVGPRICETDFKTYRVEEFLENCFVLKRQDVLKDVVYPQILNLFCSISSFGDYKYYFDYVGEHPKNVFFEKLINDEKSNFVNFTLKKMKPLGTKSFELFKEKYLNDKQRNTDIFNPQKFERIQYILENFDKIFYDACPEQGILVLNHNDAHPLNILQNPDTQKVVLCDFEYSNYNLLGFDIANYLTESLFLLHADHFPFYQYQTKGRNQELQEDKYFEIYLSFFETFEKNNEAYFESFRGYSEILKLCKTRDYYYRLIGLTSLFWFVFALIYFDYDSIKNKAGYDYFNYAFDRLNVFDDFVRSQVNLKY